MSKITTIIFDKTGTITTANQSKLSYEGTPLSSQEKSILKTILRNSNHPLSRQIYDYLTEDTLSLRVDAFKEISGKGIEAQIDGAPVKIGSSAFVGKEIEKDNLKTSVHISLGDTYRGCFTFHNSYRKGISELFQSLAGKYELIILSGDNESERLTLEKLLPPQSQILFNQKPDDKLNYVQSLQQKGKKVMMIGDGLNDAGALKQSDVGLALAENVNVFSPACDGIMDSSKIKDLKTFLNLSEKAIRIIKGSFVLSFLYNVVGISFAVLGHLSPLVAAILMPLSSITIVLFTTLSTNIIARKLR